MVYKSFYWALAPLPGTPPSRLSANAAVRGVHPRAPALVDHLVSAHQNRWRHRKAVQVSTPAAVGIVDLLVRRLFRAVSFRRALPRQTTIAGFDCFFAVVFEGVSPRCFISIDRYGLPDCLTIGLSVGGIRQEQRDSRSHS